MSIVLRLFKVHRIVIACSFLKLKLVFMSFLPVWLNRESSLFTRQQTSEAAGWQQLTFLVRSLSSASCVHVDQIWLKDADECKSCDDSSSASRNTPPEYMNKWGNSVPHHRRLPSSLSTSCDLSAEGICKVFRPVKERIARPVSRLRGNI